MDKLKDKEIVNNLMFSQNIGRILIFGLIAIPVNIIHIIYFFLNLGEPGTIEYTWRIGIISGHTLIMITSLVLGVSVYMHKRLAFPRKSVIEVLIYLFFVLLIVAGVGIVTFDQLVTPSITPFLIVCLALAMVFILRPKQSLPLFLFAFFLFFFAISLTQDDQFILLSNRVNSLTISGLGFLMSWFVWRSTRQNIIQDVIIQNQSKALEQRNKQLINQSAKLETAISSRDHFMSIISHDLKSPFNSLLGFSDILLEEWDDMPDEEKLQIVHLIKETSETTYQLLLNLLDWSRLQKEQIKVQPHQFIVKPLLENVLTQLHAQASLKGIDTIIDIESGLFALADEHMITSVLRNLISNAIKFSAKDSTVTIHARMEKDHLVCCVEDSGVGLPKDIADNIFEKATTTTGTDHEEGTGLGLQLCREFVHAHHGNIWVDSKPGKGSRFYFTIPQKQYVP